MRFNFAFESAEYQHEIIAIGPSVQYSVPDITAAILDLCLSRLAWMISVGTYSL